MLSKDMARVTPEIVSAAPLDDVMTARIADFIAKNRNIDFRGRYMNAGEGGEGVLTKVHLTEEPMAGVIQAPPYPWENQLGFNPLITLEDQAGNLTPLQYASPATEVEHVYGFLVTRDEEAFVVHAPTSWNMASGITADMVKGDDWVVTRLYGETAESIEVIGELGKATMVSEGEIVFSKEEKPLLVNAPWLSSVGDFGPGFETPEKREAADALIAAIYGKIDAVAPREPAETPEP